MMPRDLKTALYPLAGVAAILAVWRAYVSLFGISARAQQRAPPARKFYEVGGSGPHHGRSFRAGLVAGAPPPTQLARVERFSSTPMLARHSVLSSFLDRRREQIATWVARDKSVRNGRLRSDEQMPASAFAFPAQPKELRCCLSQGIFEEMAYTMGESRARVRRKHQESEKFPALFPVGREFTPTRPVRSRLPPPPTTLPHRCSMGSTHNSPMSAHWSSAGFPEAMRRLIELGLSSAPRATPKASARTAAKASQLAGQMIDMLGDGSAPVEEREKRKRRLVKGPPEFRELRTDLPKPKD